LYGHKQPFYGVNQTDASSVWDGEGKKKQLLAIHPRRK